MYLNVRRYKHRTCVEILKSMRTTSPHVDSSVNAFIQPSMHGYVADLTAILVSAVPVSSRHRFR
eukprot:14709-Eustigmatos_ZCMA.PRE.1